MEPIGDGFMGPIGGRFMEPTEEGFMEPIEGLLKLVIGAFGLLGCTPLYGSLRGVLGRPLGGSLAGGGFRTPGRLFIFSAGFGAGKAEGPGNGRPGLGFGRGGREGPGRAGAGCSNSAFGGSILGGNLLPVTFGLKGPLGVGG